MTVSTIWKGSKIAFLIIGTTIGAGYASGRELWEFFASYGPQSQKAVLLSMILFSFSCYVIMMVSHRLQAPHYRMVLEEIVGLKLANAYDVLIFLYLLSTTVVMFAGSGAILVYWELSYWIGVVLIGILVWGVFWRDVEGVMSLNSLLIPVLIAMLALACGLFLWQNNPTGIGWEKGEGHVLSAGIAFTALNILPLVAVLSAIGSKVEKAEIAISCVVSGTCLSLMSILYNQSLLFVSHEIMLYDVPLFAILQNFPPQWMVGVSVVLWLAIYTTAVSNIFGLVSRFKDYVFLPQWAVAGGFILLVIPLTTFGFTKLIQILYPLYGVLNLFILGMILLYPFKQFGLPYDKH
ncbi:hypothetical protein GCM10010965_30570 [Caldalkalibacillus thermarum]|uniref:YkvI family membrane protein n=1 Tax=Caldalkalibacillus thermarum TaxID=296745 RepID=UPI0019AC6671|nr:hypothetical protein [Caldalkalibacillus thermarum]GGK35486.1 hypothetical protein GCM10010965_30570 [Caldalkalibacillus thermarum]